MFFGRSLSSAIALITEIIITLTITIFLIFIEPYIALITVLIFMILSIVFINILNLSFLSMEKKDSLI